jgi:hypothetical protein
MGIFTVCGPVEAPVLVVELEEVEAEPPQAARTSSKSASPQEESSGNRFMNDPLFFKQIFQRVKVMVPSKSASIKNTLKVAGFLHESSREADGPRSPTPALSRLPFFLNTPSHVLRDLPGFVAIAAQGEP